MAVSGSEPVSAENLKEAVGGGVLPLIDALDGRVDECERKGVTTLWTGSVSPSGSAQLSEDTSGFPLVVVLFKSGFPAGYYSAGIGRPGTNICAPEIVGFAGSNGNIALVSGTTAKYVDATTQSGTMVGVYGIR